MREHPELLLEIEEKIRQLHDLKGSANSREAVAG
jgi:hypothetical protein